MTTDALLLFGAAASVVFVVVVTVEGARRTGYDATYHTASELELGRGGWIQRANFFLVAAGFAAVAVGVRDTLEATTGTVFLAVAALALVVAATFAPDPVRGFPPGASSRTTRPLTVQAKIHDVSGPLLAVALLGTCLAVAPELAGSWAVYTWATAVVGLVTTVWLIVAYRRDAAHTGTAQRALLATYWLWMTVLSIHLATR